MLVPLARRLGSREAEGLYAAAARHILDVRAAGHPFDKFDDWRALAELSRRLGQEDAPEIARRLLDVLPKGDAGGANGFDYFWASWWGEALAAVAGRLNPAEGERVCEAAARRILEIMSKRRADADAFAGGLGPLASRLTPATAHEGADRVLERISPNYRVPTLLIAQSFGAQSLSAVGSPGGAIAQHLAALGLLMESDEFVRPKSRWERIQLARAAGGLAGRLNQVEAQRICATAADIVLNLFYDPDVEVYPNNEVAQVLVALSKHMAEGEARKVCAAAARINLAIANDRETSGSVLRRLSAIATLAGALGEEESTEIARGLLARLRVPDFPGDGDFVSAALVEAMLSLSRRMGETKAAEFLNYALPEAYLVDRTTMWYGPEMLGGFAPRFSDQGLVDLLKSPFCAGQLRQTILAELGKRTGQSFRSQWDFVDWAAANRPDLDLSSPYRPPAE
jgi:hypothetical protein